VETRTLEEIFDAADQWGPDEILRPLVDDLQVMRDEGTGMTAAPTAS
jgi:hypothetical protein